MLDRPDEAAPEADGMFELLPGRAVALVSAARPLSRSAGGVAGNLAETYAGLAVERLRSAHRSGPVDVALLADEPGFSTLRTRPDFPLLLMALAMPADPFAR
jgi:hypothetical protein